MVRPSEACAAVGLDYIIVCGIKSLQPDPGWFEHYDREAPRSTLGMQSSAEFYAEWIVKYRQ